MVSFMTFLNIYYLYDWSGINDEAARFENCVACELHAKLRLCEDASGDTGMQRIWNRINAET